MQLLKFYIGNGIDSFDDSDISHMVHILFIWTSYMVRLGFISCLFELHMWFIMKITEVALLLAWTPVALKYIVISCFLIDSRLGMVYL